MGRSSLKTILKPVRTAKKTQHLHITTLWEETLLKTILKPVRTPRKHTILPVKYYAVHRYRKLSRLTPKTKRTTQILCGRNAALSLVKACARRSHSCHNTGQNGCQATQRPWTQIASILQNKT
jgi:hypothetical protein